MIEPISIGTSTMPLLLYNRLSQEFQYLKKDGFPLNIDVDRIGEFTFLGCGIEGAQSSEEALRTAKHYIANCLAEIIVDECEARMIKKIVRDNYYYYNEQEKQIILKKATDLLNPAGLGDYQQKERKEKVLAKILEYLDLHQELVLEGFINFRLKEYQDDLESIVNSAVDEFLLEKEYLEFIRLLRYFVDIQDSKIAHVKIIFKASGSFILLDEKEQPLKHESLEGLTSEYLENEINYDDLLISALITLAPREVELHLEKGIEPNDTIKTIENVFGNRVIMCEGCPKCRK